MLIYVLYQILLLLGGFILLGGFKLGDEVLDVSGVDAKISVCRYYGDFILDERHEL